MRPDNDEIVPIVDALRWQREYVQAAGSSTAALVLEAVARDIESGGSLGDLVPATQRFGDLPGLRIMAAVHRLALDRAAPAVARWLPTLGGTPPRTSTDEEAFRRDVVAALLRSPDALLDSLARTPQTNETGRAALLRCALTRQDPARPVRLREIGASAGLNLRADHLPGQPALEGGAMPPILDRIGCDLSPVDVSTPEGRALLGSYVWVDDVERFRRLAHAMAVAAAVPASVVQADAADFVDALELMDGTTTVLWHSAMWVYLPLPTQERILDGIARLGRTAGPARVLVHASWEWAEASAERGEFTLVTRTWSGSSADGSPVVLAAGMSHGYPARLVTAGE